MTMREISSALTSIYLVLTASRFAAKNKVLSPTPDCQTMIRTQQGKCNQTQLAAVELTNTVLGGEVILA